MSADKRVIEPRRYLVTRVEESMENGVTWQARRMGQEDIDRPTEDDPVDSQRLDAYTPEEAIVLARRERHEKRGLEERDNLFTAAELSAAVTAVAIAEGGGANRTIMGHIRSEERVSPESAEAIRKIVIAAYVEMLVGE